MNNLTIHGGEYEEWCHLGYYAMWLFKNRLFEGRYRLCYQGDKKRWDRNNVSSNYEPTQTAEKYYFLSSSESGTGSTHYREDN
jgi:hypothetical protein